MKTTRQFQRATKQVRIEINGIPGVTADLSEGGCSAEVRAWLKTGASVFGRIALGNRQFDYRGQIVWANVTAGARRVGIRFSGVEHDYFDALATAPAPT